MHDTVSFSEVHRPCVYLLFCLLILNMHVILLWKVSDNGVDVQLLGHCSFAMIAVCMGKVVFLLWICDTILFAGQDSQQGDTKETMLGYLAAKLRFAK